MAGGLDRDFWEERYRAPSERVGPPPPSAHLVAEAAGLAPGSALDAGCGEGADALWLAARGWRVAAVDIAEAAIERARAHAAAVDPDVAVRVAWRRADLGAWLPDERYDLVLAAYVHPAGPYADLVRRLATLVAPGGTLLLLGHDHGDPSTAEQQATADVQAAAPAVAALLDPDAWDVQVAETRTADHVHRDGRHGVRRDAVVRARRRA